MNLDDLPLHEIEMLLEAAEREEERAQVQATAYGVRRDFAPTPDERADAGGLFLYWDRLRDHAHSRVYNLRCAMSMRLALTI